MLFLPRRGKITPANIRMKYRRRRLKAAQHHEALAAAEHLHDAAVDNDLSAPATPLPPAGEAEATPPPAAGPSPPAPRPPPNRALHFDTQAHLPAVEPSRAPEPSPPPLYFRRIRRRARAALCFVWSRSKRSARMATAVRSRWCSAGQISYAAGRAPRRRVVKLL